MTKRQKLTFNSEELTQNLKTSKGQGMNAFFSPTSPLPTPASPKETAPNKTVKQTPTRKHARTRQPTQSKPSTHASTPTRTDAHMHARTLETLRRTLLNKKHLSSFTFRFKAEELEALDKATEEINAAVEQKISKNDIVRLSLSWLLKDYEENKHASVLARIFA